jgi:hypothetical protein
MAPPGAAPAVPLKEVKVRAAAHAARDRRVDGALWYGGGALALALAVGLGSAVWDALYGAGASVAPLGELAPGELAQVFFGGAPWLVLCSDSRKALVRNDAGVRVLRETFIEAAAVLSGRGLAKAGALNCSMVLPSGKTVYERLRLDPGKAPVLFLAAGGDRVAQLEPALLKKPKQGDAAGSRRKKSQDPEEGSSNSKGKSKSSAKAEARRAADEARKAAEAEAEQELLSGSSSANAHLGRAVAMAVKRRLDARFQLDGPVPTIKLLRASCLERRACALFLGRGPPSPKLRELVAARATSFPLLRWAYVDRTAAALNIEAELLGPAAAAAEGKLRLVVLRGKRFVGFQEPITSASETRMLAFLGKAADEPAQGGVAGDEDSDDAPADPADGLDWAAYTKIPDMATIKKKIKKKPKPQAQAQAQAQFAAQETGKVDGTSAHLDGRQERIKRREREREERQQQQEREQRAMTPEQAKQAQMERERQRREEMDRQAKQFEPESQDEEGDGDDAEADNVDADADVDEAASDEEIELDDE